MINIRYDTDYIKEPTVLCIGTFDGMHVGHQRLIRDGKKAAEEKDYKTAVYSFENIPASYLFRETAKKNLFTRHEKIAAFNRLKVDYLWLDFFDYHIANVEPEDYIKYIQKVLNIKQIVVGFNFRFGKDAKGTPETLITLGIKMGFDVMVIDPVLVNGVQVSSSQIRQFLMEGQVGKANAMLGDVYSVSGIVVHGKKMGATLGFPTINLHQEDRKLLPKCGVYATITTISGQDYQSITNVGIRPTFFDDGEVTVETHILDFDENCYSKHVTVSFVHFISEEIKLADKQALREKIQGDVEMTRQYFSKGI